MDISILEKQIAAVDRCLIDEWDPIGIKSNPQAQDEYSSYAPRLTRIAIECDPDALLRTMLEIRDGMGLDADDDADRIIAMRLIEIVRVD